MNFCNVQHFVSDVPTKKAKSLEVGFPESDPAFENSVH